MVETADLVLRGGRVVTLDGGRADSMATARVSAVAVRGDRIIAVGEDRDVRDLVGPDTRAVELSGGTVLPGINDAHLHLAQLGFSSSPFSVDLSAVGSVPALRDAVAEACRDLPEDAWLVCHGWWEAGIEEFRDGSRAPHRELLDAVTGDRPAALHHLSLHAVWANTAALRRAGVDRAMPDPPAGTIVRDADGEPTGMLHEAATPLVAEHVPAMEQPRRLDAIEAAMRTVNALGITSVTDPLVWPQLLGDYIELQRQGRMTVRVNTLLHWDWPSVSSSYESMRTALRYCGVATGLGDDWLRVGGCKLFADGIPSHSTAWMHEPYADGSQGRLVVAGDDDAARAAELANIVELAHRHRLNVQIHVCGDRAADASIDALAHALEIDPWPHARHALIHGTLLSDAAFEWLAKYGIAVVTSSVMKSYNGPSMVRTIGPKRWSRTFPAGSLLAAGVPVADSSDAPCVFPDWRRGVATFVGAAPHSLASVDERERLTREQALRLWTTAGAYLESAEERKGTIAVGKLADLVVVEEDFAGVSDQALHHLTPMLTVVGGRVVFER